MAVNMYVKGRLWNYFRNFRDCSTFVFNWLHRLTLSKIMGFYNNVKIMNFADQASAVDAGTLSSEYDKYGKRVPNSIIGSKNYCRKKLLDLLAMADRLGHPQVFFTVTQNDAWHELQRSCGYDMPLCDLVDGFLVDPANWIGSVTNLLLR